MCSVEIRGTMVCYCCGTRVPFHFRRFHCDHPLRGESFNEPTLAAFSSSRIQPLFSSAYMTAHTQDLYVELRCKRHSNGDLVIMLSEQKLKRMIMSIRLSKLSCWHDEGQR